MKRYRGRDRDRDSRKPLSELDVAGYRVRAHTSQYMRRVSAAHRAVQQALETASAWYVGCSFGKDSIVTQHLVRHYAPDTPVVFIDPGIPLGPGDDALISEYVSREKVNFVHLQWDKMDYYRAKQESRTTKRILYERMFSPLYDWFANNPQDGVFLGLRAGESAARNASLNVHSKLHRYTTGDLSGMWRCTPVADWSVDDIATYIITHNLPILDIYRKMGFSARSGLLGFGGAQYGRLAYLRKFYPALYRQFVADVPEAAQWT